MKLTVLQPQPQELKLQVQFDVARYGTEAAWPTLRSQTGGDLTYPTLPSELLLFHFCIAREKKLKKQLGELESYTCVYMLLLFC